MPVSISSNSRSSRPRAAFCAISSLVRKRRLRILVEHPHVRMRRRAVDEVVELLDVLAVVALRVVEAEQALLQDRVAPVPERRREAQRAAGRRRSRRCRPRPSGRRGCAPGRAESRPTRRRRRCSPRAPCPTAARSGTDPRRASRSPSSTWPRRGLRRCRGRSRGGAFGVSIFTGRTGGRSGRPMGAARHGRRTCYGVRRKRGRRKHARRRRRTHAVCARCCVQSTTNVTSVVPDPFLAPPADRARTRHRLPRPAAAGRAVPAVQRARQAAGVRRRPSRRRASRSRRRPSPRGDRRRARHRGRSCRSAS